MADAAVLACFVSIDLKRAMLPKIKCLFLSSFLLAACSEQKQASDPRREALQGALDELSRLESFTTTGLSYVEYRDRLLTAKANIDVALQKTDDKRANEKILAATDYYVAAQKIWNEKITTGYEKPPGVQGCWQKASNAARFAKEFALSDFSSRLELEDRERKREHEAQERVYEEGRAYLQSRQKAREEQASKDAAVARRLAEAREPRKVILRFSAADGTRDNTQTVALVMTDVNLQVPTNDGIQTLWFGDIDAVERYVANLYNIKPKKSDRLVLRFNIPAELAAFEKGLPAALSAWHREFSDVAQ
jgi:hypothetical protein